MAMAVTCLQSKSCFRAIQRPNSSALRRHYVVKCTAQTETTKIKAGEPEASSMAGTPPVLGWVADTETLPEVMAFSGPAPERVNGRAAMLGFVAIAAAEVSSGSSAWQQVGDSWGSALFVSLLLSFASIFPKFVSGSSLKDLLAAATGPNLAGAVKSEASNLLNVFDTTNELWVGRVAMIGVAGLLLTEGALGRALF